MSNQEKVMDFINHWNSRDIEGIMSLLSDDCFYHNIPMEPQTGKMRLEPTWSHLFKWPQILNG